MSDIMTDKMSECMFTYTSWHIMVGIPRLFKVILIRNIYTRSLVLPWFPKIQEQHVFWQREFVETVKKFWDRQKSLKLSSNQVQVAANCCWALWAKDQDWQGIQSSQCKFTPQKATHNNYSTLRRVIPTMTFQDVCLDIYPDVLPNTILTSSQTFFGA